MNCRTRPAWKKAGINFLYNLYRLANSVLLVAFTYLAHWGLTWLGHITLDTRSLVYDFVQDAVALIVISGGLVSACGQLVIIIKDQYNAVREN